MNIVWNDVSVIWNGVLNLNFNDVTPFTCAKASDKLLAIFLSIFVAEKSIIKFVTVPKFVKKCKLLQKLEKIRTNLEQTLEKA